MGVWIETKDLLQSRSEKRVTPCMGVWIETSWNIAFFGFGKSHPVWVCGLKLASKETVATTQSHTLYGCVD